MTFYSSRFHFSVARSMYTNDDYNQLSFRIIMKWKKRRKEFCLIND